jgi:hypothetical protein
VIIAVSLSSYKDVAAKTGIDRGIHTRVELRFFQSKIKTYSIEPFCPAIRRISWIFIPLSAVVRLWIFIPKWATSKDTLLGGFKEIEWN